MSDLRETLRDCTRALQSLLTAMDSESSPEDTLRSSESCRASFASLIASWPAAAQEERVPCEAELEELRRFTTLALDVAGRAKTRTGERLCEARRTTRIVASSGAAAGAECDVAG